MIMNKKLATLFLLGVASAHAEKNGLRNNVESVRSESLSSGLVMEFVRKGKGQGSGQMCVDSQKRRFDYGERKLNKDDGRTVSDCAQYCVSAQQEESDLMKHMVGFNFHFEDSLCQCLYKNKELKSTSGFDSLVVKHEGEDKVEGVELKSGWQCYAGVGISSGADSGIPFRKQAEDNDSSDDTEEAARLGNDIDVDLTVTYAQSSSSSSGASRSRKSYGNNGSRGGNDGRGGNNAGASSLCISDADCTNPELPFCRLGHRCRGQGVCGAAPDSCPTSK